MKVWFRLARRLAGPLFAIVPRRYRFAVAVRAARLLAPIAPRFAFPLQRALNDNRSIALWGVNHILNGNGIEFDIPIDVEGAAIIDEAQRSGRGLLLVSAHFILNSLLVPWLRDRGWSVSVVRAGSDPAIDVPGRREQLPWFAPSSQLLVRIRQALRDGGLVMIAVDSPEPVSSGFTLVKSGMPIHISDVAPRMAGRWGASVAFLETRATPAGIAATITPGEVGLRAIFEQWLGEQSVRPVQN